MSEAVEKQKSDATKVSKKQESNRSVVIVGVLCASFLWWWFTLDPAPEAVGPLGLVPRALHDELHETAPAPATRPLAVDFDLLELSMSFLRAGNFRDATKLAASIYCAPLQARGLRAIAYGHLAKDKGAMSPALQALASIADPALRDASREQILLEIARLGFADVAWEQASSLALKISLLRTMAETDAQAEAAERVKILEPEILTQQNPDTLDELLWTHVALKNADHVFQLVDKLPEPKQDEIYLELFRMIRLENADLTAPTLARLPTRLQLRARLEAAKLNGTLEAPQQLVAALERAAQESPSLENALFLTQAQWQLEQPSVEAWRKSAAATETFFPNTTPEDRLAKTLQLAQIYYDALDPFDGHRLLETARQEMAALPDATTRLPHMAQLLESAFRNAETNFVQELLRDLTQDFVALPAALPSTLHPALRQVCVAIFREGDWQPVLDLLPKFPVTVQNYILTRLADLPVESSAGQGFAISQDKQLAIFRQAATIQGEKEAGKLAIRQPTGLARSRAWLEIAKGLVLKQMIDAQAAAPTASEAPKDAKE